LDRESCHLVPLLCHDLGEKKTSTRTTMFGQLLEAPRRDCSARGSEAKQSHRRLALTYARSASLAAVLSMRSTISPGGYCPHGQLGQEPDETGTRDDRVCCACVRQTTKTLICKKRLLARLVRQLHMLVGTMATRTIVPRTEPTVVYRIYWARGRTKGRNTNHASPLSSDHRRERAQPAF
jgi:hypothetical protein